LGGYLRRLATTGAAYTTSSVLSKLIAVALLPLYTRYLTPSDYGAAEVLVTTVIAASIIIRLGMTEAMMRFFYREDENPNRVVASGFFLLLTTATLSLLIAFPFADEISDLLLDKSDPTLARIAVFGLWIYTMYDFCLTLFRLDERAKAYLVVTVSNVLVTIPLTVYLVVFRQEGAQGLLLGQYASGGAFLLALLVVQSRRIFARPDPALLKRMLRFGFPTMPAELSLYSLNFIDRLMLVRLASLADAGLYSLSVKFAQGVTVLVKGFQLAWPPLAYSIRDDDEASRTYAAVVTWFVAGCSLVVAALWLFAPWIVRLLAAPRFFASYEAVGLVSLGMMLFALYLVLVVVLGRTGRTEFSFPATIAGTAANVGLNLFLIPRFGIVGAGVALVCSYAITLVIMFVVTQRLFPVPYEWLRLLQVLVLAGCAVAVGVALTPIEGIGSFAIRSVLLVAYPLALIGTGFLHDHERRAAASMLKPSAVLERLSALRANAPEEEVEGGGPRMTSEVIEAESRDEDAIT
jgi:O-antigen/teichoic acid export membrane protein